MVITSFREGKLENSPTAGAALIVVTTMIVLGGHKRAEAGLVDKSPAWLTDLTTRY